MIPVSVVHFAVTLSYVILGLVALKMIAINKPESSFGKAIAFATF